MTKKMTLAGLAVVILAMFLFKGGVYAAEPVYHKVEIEAGIVKKEKIKNPDIPDSIVKLAESCMYSYSGNKVKVVCIVAESNLELFLARVKSAKKLKVLSTGVYKKPLPEGIFNSGAETKVAE